jgi:dipeptidyl-peptidase III
VRLLPALLLPLLLAACSAPADAPPPAAAAPERPVLLLRVDDVAVAQLHADGFENLSPRDQALCYHLARAAVAGRDIYLQQKCAEGAAIRDLLEELVTHPGGIYPIVLAELQRYTLLFWVNAGIYNSITSRKNVLRCSPEDLAAATAQAVKNGALVPEPDALLARLQPWLFDPAFEPMSTAKNPEGGLDIVQASSCSFYGPDVTLADLEGFEEQYELNSNVVKGADGKLQELVWRAGSAPDGVPPGLYAAELERVIGCLEDALPYAPEATAAALRKLIRFYRTGAVADREAYDIAWVEDSASAVDTINGFIEVYVDPRGKKGSWEGVVFYEDPEKAELIKGLADSAQWFEDHMPYDAAYRKPQVKGISARSIDVVCETGDSGPVTPVGINLPNDQRIREDHGSKSVSLANVVAAGDALGNSGVRDEFCWDEAERARNTKWGGLTGEMLTNMHEVIGHASGQQDAEHQGDPTTWIKENMSALEEGRADLVGLYFMRDPKLKEMGLLDDPDEASLAAYEAYTRNGLMLQLRRVREGTQIEEDHMRNRQMVAGWILKNSDAIQERVRDGEHYYVVVDADEWREAAGRLLALVQKIKSTGDYEAAKKLFDDYGVHFDPALRDEIVQRYEALGVASYTGFVMPRLSPVWGPDGALSDVTISYPESLAAQMLEWTGRQLPPVSLPEDPAALYYDVLHRLLDAPELELAFRIETTGANTASKTGTLHLGLHNRLELKAEGPFNGASQPIDVRCDGKRLTGTAAGGALDHPAAGGMEHDGVRQDPPLRDGVLQALMARGLMHNLAMLSMGRAMDTSDGTPYGCVATGFRALPDGQVDGRATRRIAFVMQIGGQTVGEVTLDISQSTGLPLHREVLVHFPQGDMQVTEDYSLRRPVGGASMN